MTLRTKQTSDVDAPDKRMNTDNRMQCPICLLNVADLSGRTSLTKHLASHLERFSLDCLPLNTSSWGNENALDDESESSTPDQDQAPPVHEQPAPNDQDTTTESMHRASPQDIAMFRQRTTGADVMTDDEIRDVIAAVRRKTFVDRTDVLEQVQTLNRMSKNAISSDQQPESYITPWQIVKEQPHIVQQLVEQQSQTNRPSLYRSFAEEAVWKGDAKDSGSARRLTRLEVLDFTRSQINAMIGEEHEHEHNQQSASRKPQIAAAAPPPPTPPPPPPTAGPLNPHVPVYAKVHTEHMAIETLEYYDIPWEYDKVGETRSLFDGIALISVTVRSLLYHYPP